MLEIRYKPSFLREFRKLPSELQDEVREKIALFRRDPRLSSLKTHKLKGLLQGRWSFSINYRYRIVFRYEGKGIAALLAVGDHEVYKA